MTKTIFEKIIEGELPAQKVYEDENILVIEDKYPKAPVHLLLIPKKPIPNIGALQEGDFLLLGEIFRVAQKIASEKELDEKGGYRLLVNNGPNAGQTIAHLHFHLLGGRPLGAMG
ncbi:MAG: Purine nucleoside phosphoramidase [Chlamydiae bacterium]|nr:Purine nucleoside phosphoramidase [Chlamydiota bacterium]